MLAFYPKDFQGKPHLLSELEAYRQIFECQTFLTIGLGGGSYVECDKVSSGPIKVGPLSAGYNIVNEAYVFCDSADDNRRLTATDIAVAAGLASVGKQEAIKDLDKNFGQVCNG